MTTSVTSRPSRSTEKAAPPSESAEVPTGTRATSSSPFGFRRINPRGATSTLSIPLRARPGSCLTLTLKCQLAPFGLSTVSGMRLAFGGA